MKLIYLKNNLVLCLLQTYKVVRKQMDHLMSLKILKRKK